MSFVKWNKYNDTRTSINIIICYPIKVIYTYNIVSIINRQMHIYHILTRLFIRTQIHARLIKLNIFLNR